MTRELLAQAVSRCNTTCCSDISPRKTSFPALLGIPCKNQMTSCGEVVSCISHCVLYVSFWFFCPPFPVRRAELFLLRRVRDPIGKYLQNQFQFNCTVWQNPKLSVTSQSQFALPHSFSSTQCSLVFPGNSCVLMNMPGKLCSNHLYK